MQVRPTTRAHPYACAGDGIIGVEDLESSLAHVAISCCRTRCIYRAPRGLAHKLLAQTQAAGQTDGRCGATSMTLSTSGTAQHGIPWLP